MHYHHANFGQVTGFLARVAEDIDLEKPAQDTKAAARDKPEPFAFQDSFNPMRRKLLLHIEE